MERPENAVILEYSKQGLMHTEIAKLLEKHEGIVLSPDAIRKRLKRMGALSRKGPTIHSRDDIKRSIEEVWPETSYTVGYRSMTAILRQRGMHVRRDTVMEVMREIDPAGVNQRRRRRVIRRVYRSFGPNHTWHIDGYDKLKPFGFPIHGCIDGFSRLILWLKVLPSNNDPAITALNYVECVDKMKGCPLILQSDPGTENSLMAAIQCMLRHSGMDPFSGVNSYRAVRSKLNQRIEAWWSMFRRQTAEWWINFFKDLESFGAFRRGNLLDVQCVRYCFMPCIQHELDELVERWNSHHISFSRNAECPNGRPIVLFSVPEDHGGRNCLQKFEQEDMEFAFAQCQIPTRSGSIEFDNFASTKYLEMGWHDASDWKDALQKYFYLRDVLPHA